jgi:hypothetical protein
MYPIPLALVCDRGHNIYSQMCVALWNSWQEVTSSGSIENVQRMNPASRSLHRLFRG